MTPRFVRHFTVLNIPSPSEQSLERIFLAIFGGFLGVTAPLEISHKMLKPVVQSSIEIYQRLADEMLPTPNKSHYTFNLRDLGKVFQGMLMVRPTVVQTKDGLADLWVHECKRVFHDRLLDEDKLTFNEMLYDMLKLRFGTNLMFNEWLEEPPILFGDFTKMELAVHEREYERVADVGKLRGTLEEYQMDQSEQKRKKQEK